MRKLAKIVKIDSVINHPNADRLDLCKVGGWQVVSKRDLYKAGDLAVYLEIDSWVPHSLDPSLTKEGQEPKVFNDVPGQRLRTVKLRGELSQGLLIPVNVGIGGFTWIRELSSGDTVLVDEGQDVTEILGIQKWELPENAQLAGDAKGLFPSQFPKTDQERIQNLTRQFEEWKERKLTFTVQEKLEGSSMTCYLLDGVFGVCSRNLDLKEDPNNTFWKVARELDIENKMRTCLMNTDGSEANIAIQGELIGPGIQGNIYGLDKPTMRVFDIVEAGNTYLTAQQVKVMCCVMDLQTVPYKTPVLEISKIESVDELLKLAEGKSALNEKQEREGLVFKCNEDPSITFKAISNKYLLK